MRYALCGLLLALLCVGCMPWVADDTPVGVVATPTDVTGGPTSVPTLLPTRAAPLVGPMLEATMSGSTASMRLPNSPHPNCLALQSSTITSASGSSRSRKAPSWMIP